ncbi:MAG: IPT/TIG domain-containing protein [Acidobacteriota bacterium]|nr:IPT/TIG domain-containing protein [Acidobacteriota bacterium]
MKVLFFLLCLTVGVAQVPVVNPDGVANSADSEKPVTPGELVAIYGTNLAPRTEVAAVIPLPKSLAGVTVTFNGIAAPLLFVSAGQINAQLPWELPSSGTVTMVVNNGMASSTQNVPVGPLSAGIFATFGRAIAIAADGSLAAPTGSIPGLPAHPVNPGDTLIILATGLGPVTPPAVTGADSHDAIRQTITKPTVLVGGVQAQVLFSGLSPQFVGVNQVNIVVPPNAPSGDRVLLQIAAGGMVTLGGFSIAVNQGWPQWGQNAQHDNATPSVGQSLNNRLTDIVYDPLVPQLQAAGGGDLLAHYQVPLVDGNDFFMEFKSGSVNANNPVFAGETWGENKFTWQNGLASLAWSYTSDWKAPGSLNDFWEPVFHPALANGALYVPGASGSIVKWTGPRVSQFSASAHLEPIRTRTPSAPSLMTAMAICTTTRSRSWWALPRTAAFMRTTRGIPGWCECGLTEVSPS